MCPLPLFLSPPQRVICCYCLWSPGPIFYNYNLAIHLPHLYSHLSHLSFNFHWIWILIQLMCPLHLFWPPQRSYCYYLSSPGPFFIIIIWLCHSLLLISLISLLISLNLGSHLQLMCLIFSSFLTARISLCYLSSPGPSWIYNP